MKNLEKIRQLEEELKQVEDEEIRQQIEEDIQGLKDYEKGVCCWCEDAYELSELYHTNLGAMCQHCIDAIRSRGEKIKVEDSYWCCEDELEEDDE